MVEVKKVKLFITFKKYPTKGFLVLNILKEKNHQNSKC